MPLPSKKYWRMQRVDLPELQAELYLPSRSGVQQDSPAPSPVKTARRISERRSALVIMPSSAGVCDVRERYYARHFADAGLVCLVVDSFLSRSLSPGLDSRNTLSDRDMVEDALCGWRLLADRNDVDSEHIAILGVSRGGGTALHTAMHLSGPERFAAHVAIVPPAFIQPRHPMTTKAPILMLLAGKDDFTGTEPALRYAERLRMAEANIVVHIFPEACHAWESCGKPLYYPEVPYWPDCSFLLEEDGSYTSEQTGENLSESAFRELCAGLPRRGAHAGGGSAELKARTCSLIEQFFVRHGLVVQPSETSNGPDRN